MSEKSKRIPFSPKPDHLRLHTENANAQLVGMERILRFLQSLCQILVSFPSVLSIFLSLCSLSVQESAQIQTVTGILRGRLNLARRYFRFFRFLDSFYVGHVLYHAPGDKPLELWLDILNRSMLGMYGLLESAALPDSMEVPGFEVWGPVQTRKLNIEAQRFWFFALALGVLSATIKLVKLYAYAPVPAAGDGYGTGEKEDFIDAATDMADGRKKPKEKGGKAELDNERQRLKEAVDKRKREREREQRRVLVRSKSRALFRKMAADSLDMLLPGHLIGWIKTDPGTVGVAMMITSVITSIDVWERCGAQVRSKGRTAA
jgi:hypothetical protein